MMVAVQEGELLVVLLQHNEDCVEQIDDFVNEVDVHKVHGTDAILTVVNFLAGIIELVLPQHMVNRLESLRVKLLLLSS
jgi:hypothetical protein